MASTDLLKRGYHSFVYSEQELSPQTRLIIGLSVAGGLLALLILIKFIYWYTGHPITCFYIPVFKGRKAARLRRAQQSIPLVEQPSYARQAEPIYAPMHNQQSETVQDSSFNHNTAYKGLDDPENPFVENPFSDPFEPAGKTSEYAPNHKT